MGSMTFVPVRLWPLSEDHYAKIDAGLHAELIRAGCDEETIEYETWERTSIEIDGDLVDGYARAATGTKPS